MAGRFIDLSHPIEDGMIPYHGLPAPRVGTFLSREDTARESAPGVSFHVGRIDLVANTGTYLDAPFHYDADGVDVAELPLERLVDVPAICLRVYGLPVVGVRQLGEPDRLWGKAVLMHTGWSRHWGTEQYRTGGPYLTEEAAGRLVDANIALLGVDALDVDDIDDPARPVHRTLLSNSIPIVEHLTNLDQVPDQDFRLTTLPAPVRRIGSFPVRAVAVLGQGLEPSPRLIS
jgi:arylformamidase